MGKLTIEQRKVHNATYYIKNKEKQLQRQRIKRDELRKYVLNIKQTSCCKVCGEKHIAVLDFHHRDSKTKDTTVAIAINREWSIKRLQQEIDKCDILCSNCHRKLHWNERASLTQLVE